METVLKLLHADKNSYVLRNGLSHESCSIFNNQVEKIGFGVIRG